MGGALTVCDSKPFVSKFFTLDFKTNDETLFNKNNKLFKLEIEKLIFNKLIDNSDLTKLNRGYLNKTGADNKSFYYFKQNDKFLLYLPSFSMGNIRLHSTISNLQVAADPPWAGAVHNKSFLKGNDVQKKKLIDSIVNENDKDIIDSFKEFGIGNIKQREAIENRLLISITNKKLPGSGTFPPPDNIKFFSDI